jgi:hypothetical protein
MSLNRRISVSDLKKEIAKRKSSDALPTSNIEESDSGMDHKKSSKTTTRSPEKTKGRNQRSATLFDLSPPSSSPSPPEASVPPRADSNLRPLRLELGGQHARSGLYTTRVRHDCKYYCVCGPKSRLVARLSHLSCLLISRENQHNCNKSIHILDI